MADVTYSVQKSGRGQDISYLKKYIVLEVDSLSNTDTITVVELAAVDTARVIDLEDGTVYSVTLATNVITVDDSGCSSDHVVVVAVGT